MSASGIARSTKRSALPPMNTNSRPPSERMSGVTYGRPGCATMSGSVTSGVGEGSTVGDGRGVATATGDTLAGGCEGAGGVWTGTAHADRTAAARRIATFISRPTLAPGRSCEGSAAGRLWAGVARSMPLRFFRRVRIAKGLTLNLSKRGASLSAPTLPITPPTPRLTTVPPVPAVPTLAPALLPTLAPPTLAPPTLAPAPALPTFVAPTLAPPALAPNLCGAPANPWGYNFC